MGELECPHCGKTYKMNKWLQNHLKTKHPGIDTPVAGTIASTNTIASTTDSTSAAAAAVQSVVQEYNDTDSDADEASELAAAQNLDWGDWSGTDDEEEVESYLVLEPWREDEAEENLREVQAGVATVDLNPRKETAKPVLVKCKSCPESQGFTTIEGYVKHLVGHGMQAAFLRLPTLEEIRLECPQILSAVCTELQELKLTKGHGPIIAASAEKLKTVCDSDIMGTALNKLCKSLLSFLEEKSDYLFPSAFAGAFFEHSSRVLLDKNVRDWLSTTVLSYVDLVDNNAACNIFVTNLIMKFSSKLLSHLLRTICKGVDVSYVPQGDRYAVTSQSVMSLDFKQNMHYIGGSNVKSILRTALRVKHRNQEWQRVITTIKQNFLISEFSTAPDKELMAWTESLDRGKLTKISQKALDFFVQLGTEVKPLERLDGSLLNEEVFDKVVTSPSLLLRWDELKGSLLDNESFKLLHAITSQFCVTWRNGIIGRRLDELAATKEANKFGTGGVAFRSTLGGK